MTTSLTQKGFENIKVEKYAVKVLKHIAKVFYTANYTPVTGGQSAVFKTADLLALKAAIDEILAKFPD